LWHGDVSRFDRGGRVSSKKSEVSKNREEYCDTSGFGNFWD